MKFLPRGISTFRTLIEQNYIYVDKTKEIYNLFSTGDRYFFLSRPRRFGKSLLISTMKELFEGNRELFKDLWIDQQLEYTWPKYPVIHLDMNAVSDVIHLEQLENTLINYIILVAQKLDIDLERDTPRNLLFNFVTSLYERRGPVVILIDEYDKPLIDHIDKREYVLKIRDFLQSFYGILKSLDACLRIVFITGVSKFSKTSIFSGLNNLVDISLHPSAAILLGYTKDEILRDFSDHIDLFSQSQDRSREEIMLEMQEWYNGYKFSPLDLRVFNPFSVICYLKDYEASNYWFETGTPTFLLKLIRQQYPVLLDMAHCQLTKAGLSTFEVDRVSLEAILFQTGYLTIESYNREKKIYTLNYPNLELVDSFHQLIVGALVNVSYQQVDSAAYKLVEALNQDDLEVFFASLQTLFAHITYYQRVQEEAFYHALFQFLGVLLGLRLQSEVLTDKGRIDLVLKTTTHIYIFEIKHNATADMALEQIDNKKYYERYLLDRRKIVLIGISCNDVAGPVEIEWKQRRL